MIEEMASPMERSSEDMVLEASTIHQKFYQPDESDS